MKTLILYHAACADGTFAAAIAGLAHTGNDVHYMPVGYGSEDRSYITDKSGVSISSRPDLMAYDSLVFVDIAPVEEQLADITYHLEQPKDSPKRNLTVLDHHNVRTQERYAEECEKRGVKPREVTFSSDLSGAMLTYFKYLPNFASLVQGTLAGKLEDLAPIAQLVSDRDTWQRDKERAFQFYEGHSPIVFATTDDIGALYVGTSHTVGRAISIITECRLEELIRKGAQAIKTRDAFIDDLLATKAKICTTPEVKEPHAVFTAARAIASEAAAQAQSKLGVNLALVWRLSDCETKVFCSWRSTAGSSITAKEVCESYGGNGHPNAAGCSMSVEHFIAMYGTNVL